MGCLFGLALCLSALIASIDCETFPQCDGADSLTFVRSPTGCRDYIYCEGDESFQGSCAENELFNVIDQVCDDPNNVQCDTAEVETTSQAASSVIPSETTSSGPTNSPSTNAVSSSSTIATTSTSSSSVSGQVECPSPAGPNEITYIPSPESCADYFMCYSGIPIPMTCPKELQFNAMTSSCDWAEMANCRITGTTTPSPREQCNGQTHGYFEYPQNCRYYYRCINGMLTIQECPIGFGWDANRKMCSTTPTGCLI